MKAAIHQPNFFPWYGYFSKLVQSDVFIFQDDCAMPMGRSHVYRSGIRSAEHQPQYIRAARKNSRSGELICDAAIDESPVWRAKLLKTIEQNYRQAEWFEQVHEPVAALIRYQTDRLADYNIHAIIGILSMLPESKTTFRRSSEFDLTRLRAKEAIPLMLKQVQADVYLSGQGKGSAAVTDVETLTKSGIQVRHVSADTIRYRSPGFPFVYGLSILDMLFLAGPEKTMHLLVNEA